MAELSVRHADLAYRGVLITGGGSGIGAALVEGFAAQGAKVAFLDIAEEPSRALAERLSENSPHPVLYLKADLRNVAETQAAVNMAAEKLASLSVLINNAGWDDRHELEEVTEEYWDNSQAVNLKQMFFVAQAAVPYLRKSGGGAIVNFSSIAFLLNMGGLPSYASAKAGIIGLTKSLAGKLGRENIRVNAILPGIVAGERQERVIAAKAASYNIGHEEMRERLLSKVSMRKMVTAQDIANQIIYICSPAGSAISGQSLSVCGNVEHLG